MNRRRVITMGAVLAALVAGGAALMLTHDNEPTSPTQVASDSIAIIPPGPAPTSAPSVGGDAHAAEQPAPAPVVEPTTEGLTGLPALRANPTRAAGTVVEAFVYADSEEGAAARADRLAEWIAPGSPALTAPPLRTPAAGEQVVITAVTGATELVEATDVTATVRVDAEWEVSTWMPGEEQRDETETGTFVVRLAPAGDGTWKASDVALEQAA